MSPVEQEYVRYRNALRRVRKEKPDFSWKVWLTMTPGERANEIIKVERLVGNTVES